MSRYSYGTAETQASWKKVSTTQSPTLQITTYPWGLPEKIPEPVPRKTFHFPTPCSLIVQTAAVPPHSEAPVIA